MINTGKTMFRKYLMIDRSNDLLGSIFKNNEGNKIIVLHRDHINVDSKIEFFDTVKMCTAEDNETEEILEMMIDFVFRRD